MKTIIKISAIVLFSTILFSKSFGQNINWESLRSEDRHILSINAGMEHGLVFGASYGYQVRMIVPAVINVEYSFPSGENVIDDFKSKIGIRIRFVSIGHFKFSGNIHGVYRRNQNNLVRIQNFGSDLSANIGYYRKHWFLAGEIGFDKAIITHLKHTNYYRDIFPEVQDGWFGPPTGGNFYYGVMTGVSMGKHDITLKAGKILTQDFKTKPMIPYYAQLGYSFRF